MPWRSYGDERTLPSLDNQHSTAQNALLDESPSDVLRLPVGSLVLSANTSRAEPWEGQLGARRGQDGPLLQGCSDLLTLCSYAIIAPPEETGLAVPADSVACRTKGQDDSVSEKE
jgi:hypothetical protein